MQLHTENLGFRAVLVANFLHRLSLLWFNHCHTICTWNSSLHIFSGIGNHSVRHLIWRPLWHLQSIVDPPKCMIRRSIQSLSIICQLRPICDMLKLSFFISRSSSIVCRSFPWPQNNVTHRYQVGEKWCAGLQVGIICKLILVCWLPVLIWTKSGSENSRISLQVII